MTIRNHGRQSRAPRMTDWTVITIVLMVMLAMVAPTKLAVILYKVGLVAGGGVLGYWIDRALFPYARPDKVHRVHQPWAGLRRAIVVLACVIGMTMGL